jgi:hypothetical protein
MVRSSNNMNKKVERFYPLCAGVLAGFAWHYFQPPMAPDGKEFLAAAISLGAVLTGFIATAKAILAALPNQSTMKYLREGKYIDDLIDYLAHALYGCLFFSIIALAGFFLLKANDTKLPEWFGVVMIGMGTFALLSFHRVARLLFKIIRRSGASNVL